jgi:hypothetical protein
VNYGQQDHHVLELHVTSNDIKYQIIDKVAQFYATRCRECIGEYLEALYLFGSYAFGKISLDVPDLNYFILLKEGIPPEVFLKHADVLKEVVQNFKDVAAVRPEYRPTRYVYPRTLDGDFVIFMCLRYARMEDRHGPIPFGMGWIFEAVLQSRKLIFGTDILAEVHQPPATKAYVKTYFPPAFSHIWPPLESAPYQFKLPEESQLLMHEAHKVAQMASIGFGVTLALDEQELAEKAWLEYVTDKHKLVRFYRERYDETAAQNVATMLDIRDNWQKYKNNPEMALKMYRAAIEICTRIKKQYRELARHSEYQ